MKLWSALLFGIGGAAILVGLTFWQVQRLAWKEALIAEIEARFDAAPVALPQEPQRDADAWRPVEAEGAFADQALHVLTSTRGGGPGFRVVAPFETEGRRILVDRGYIREAEKDAAHAKGPMTLQGHLVWPRESDVFTPEPNLDRNIWFARDVDLMAEALGTEPVLLVAGQPTGTPAPLPLPVTVNLPNNHLQYAITWGALAITWLAMTGILVYRIRRGEG